MKWKGFDLMKPSCSRTYLVLVMLVFSVCSCASHPSLPIEITDNPMVSIVDVAPLLNEDEVILRVRHDEKHESFLGELYDYAVRHFPDGVWSKYGPDSYFREIEFVGRGQTVMLRSWHPIYEQSPGVVAVSHGLTPIGNRSREEILREDDPTYVSQRNAFDEIEARLLSRFGR